MSEQQTAEEQAVPEEPAVPEAPPVERRGLHEPWRAVVAGAEVVAMGLVIWAAVWCWSRSDVTITTVLDNGTTLLSTRDLGYWQGAAIVLGAVAGVLLLDALRQLVLAVRVRGKSKHAAHS